MHILRTSKWDMFVQINEPSFRDLLLEFLATFSFEKHSVTFDKPNTIQFRIGDHHFQLSLTKFSVHYGFYTLDFTTILEYYQCLYDLGNTIPRVVWNDFCAPDAPAYDARMTKGSTIRDPALRYLHHLVTATISGRRESTGVVTQRDFFLLVICTRSIIYNYVLTLSFY